MTRLATSIRRVVGIACHARAGALARPILGWSISSVKSCPSGLATKNRRRIGNLVKVSAKIVNLCRRLRGGIFSKEAA